MSYGCQLVAVFAILIVAALNIVKNIYMQVRKGDKCSGCPISYKCNKQDKSGNGHNCNPPSEYR